MMRAEQGDVLKIPSIQYPVVVVSKNFFNESTSDAVSGLDCHEISFYYLMKPRGTRELSSNSFTQGVKESMHWIKIDDLDKYKAFPTFLQRSRIPSKRLAKKSINSRRKNLRKK